MTESLWPSIETISIESNDSIQILRNQAKIIQKETKNVIRATFSKMNYKQDPARSFAQIGQVLKGMPSFFEEELEEELANKTDVNDLYSKTKYKFEIYNDEYRFRLFIMNYSEMFPVSLYVDEGILESISYTNLSEINSNSELKSVVREIFKSTKVTMVISKMMSAKK